ncbi:hypothetical protein EJ05DRAFT_514941 [Pseudovirgaria hyperparasitica]|uniref:Uncharacterized protein n=1 Tax=Pseudovirgaria hyperparasitica TaxID=470096 RepID=A0A6A6VSA2_9PEZI|nr:uncharacterized protein EJ05DRAFT_514941 [Pseudovirgaria hyperparasitica]KAF2753472.1 hypothetical protein EJ05DRAFT_514941 [Pseudovirgaria hyperparasitica]
MKVSSNGTMYVCIMVKTVHATGRGVRQTATIAPTRRHLLHRATGSARGIAWQHKMSSNPWGPRPPALASSGHGHDKDVLLGTDLSQVVSSLSSPTSSTSGGRAWHTSSSLISKPPQPKALFLQRGSSRHRHRTRPLGAQEQPRHPRPLPSQRGDIEKATSSMHRENHHVPSTTTHDEPGPLQAPERESAMFCRQATRAAGVVGVEKGASLGHPRALSVVRRKGTPGM